MSSHTTDEASAATHEVRLTEENTFQFIPGPRRGVSCPNCFRDQLLDVLIHEGACRQCGAAVRVRLEVETD